MAKPVSKRIQHSESSSLSQSVRSDARRNREEIIRAAYHVLAEVGVDAKMTAIAARADVGLGTLYRNFPSKEALVEALVLERLTRAADGASRVVVREDAWESLRLMLVWISRRQIENRVLSQFLGGRITATPELLYQRDRLYKSVETVVRRAKRAGQLRRDVGVTDIRVIMVALAALATSEAPATRRVVDHYLNVIMEGLRAPGHQRLPGRPLKIEEGEAAITFRTRGTDRDRSRTRHSRGRPTTF